MDAAVLNKVGKTFYPLMGCYGIGVSRILGAAIEQSHDEIGIIWPIQIAPDHVHLLKIGKNEEVQKCVDLLYENFKKNNIEVLYDNREIAPEIMFNDADLLGLSIRIVVGESELKKNWID